MNKTVTDNELGAIVLTKKNRTKRLIIRVKLDCVAVTLPTYSTYDDALAFVNSKRSWILAQQHKLKTRQQPITNENPFQTFTFQVKLQAAHRKDFFISLKNGVLTIEHPEAVTIESERAQAVFRKAIENGLKHEAKRVLPVMLEKLAKQYGFTFADVKISSGKTRWGSCSSRGNINLAFYLLLLPEHLINYVLLHELCHTKEMNHGPRFWQLLNSVSNNRAKALATEIKKYSIVSIF